MFFPTKDKEMRDIKFRAWDGKEMHRSGGYYTTTKQVELTVHYAGLKPAIFMQFTGKKDQNGKDIYEGDINQDKGKVIWNQDSASFDWEYPSDDIHPMAEEEEWCEVIGNIYENPTLLDQNHTVL